MDPTRTWEESAARARAGLAPLEFLLGAWRGEGSEDGRPLVSSLTARRILDGSWVEVRESLTDPEGRPIHEDLCLYRFDPADDVLRVIHCMAGGWRREWPVEPADGGIRWLDGPAGARVALIPEPDGWRAVVTRPGEDTPCLSLRYRPAEP